MLIYVDIGMGDRICDMICSCISWSIHVFDYLCIHTFIHGGSFFRPLFMHCILFVWIWKMLILHSVLQCFMLFSESVRSAKVSMSARINLTFVRAEK